MRCVAVHVLTPADSDSESLTTGDKLRVGAPVRPRRGRMRRRLHTTACRRKARQLHRLVLRHGRPHHPGLVAASPNTTLTTVSPLHHATAVAGRQRLPASSCVANHLTSFGTPAASSASERYCLMLRMRPYTTMARSPRRIVRSTGSHGTMPDGSGRCVAIQAHIDPVSAIEYLSSEAVSSILADSRVRRYSVCFATNSDALADSTCTVTSRH